VSYARCILVVCREVACKTICSEVDSQIRLWPKSTQSMHAATEAASTLEQTDRLRGRICEAECCIDSSRAPSHHCDIATSRRLPAANCEHEGEDA